MNPSDPTPTPVSNAVAAAARLGFVDDFRRFFLRGLAALLPTLITLGLLIWIWNFLWNNVGFYVIYAIKMGALEHRSTRGTDSPYAQFGYIGRHSSTPTTSARACWACRWPFC